MPLTTRIYKPTYAIQQNDKENVRPNENYTINGATASTVPAWKKMKTETTAKTGWINCVHQHEKMHSENHDSKWSSSNVNSTISNSTHREALTILAPNFDPAHPETYTEPHENTSIVQEKNKDLISKTLSCYLNGLIIKTIHARMNYTQLDAKMVDRI